MSEAQRGCVDTRSVAQCASGSERVSGQAETIIVVVVSELLTGKTGEKPTGMRWAEGFTMLAPRPREGPWRPGFSKQVVQPMDLGSNRVPMQKAFHWRVEQSAAARGRGKESYTAHRTERGEEAAERRRRRLPVAKAAILRHRIRYDKIRWSWASVQRAVTIDCSRPPPSKGRGFQRQCSACPHGCTLGICIEPRRVSLTVVCFDCCGRSGLKVTCAVHDTLWSVGVEVECSAPLFKNYDQGSNSSGAVHASRLKKHSTPQTHTRCGWPRLGRNRFCARPASTRSSPSVALFNGMQSLSWIFFFFFLRWRSARAAGIKNHLHVT